MKESEEIPVPGVRGLDHTADVGLEVSALDLPELFRRAALGAVWLVMERVPFQGGDPHDSAPETLCKSVDLAEEDLSALLRAWLRTVLLWAEVDGFVVADAEVILLPTPLCRAEDGQAFGLKALASGWLDNGPRIREIKGVTLHGLVVERRVDGWVGRVIFDV